MVVNDPDIMRFRGSPAENYPPLIIDTDTVETSETSA